MLTPPSNLPAVRRRATPGAIDTLRRVSLHRSREVLLLEGPVRSCAPVLVEPLPGLPRVARGYLTGRERFTFALRIATEDSEPHALLDAMAEYRGFRASFISSYFAECPAFYAFYANGTEAPDLQDRLLALHALAMEVYRAKEQPLYPPGFPIPLIVQKSGPQFAIEAIEALQPL